MLNFSDGSLIPDEGIGAAASHFPTGIISPANLGNPAYRTVYEAELVGIRMADDLTLKHRTRIQRSFWFMVNNQPSIRALTQPLRASPGLSLRQVVVASILKLLNTSPVATVTLVWCPSHTGIQENEDVDLAAKEATSTGVPQHLPLSLAAVKQLINAQRRASVKAQPATTILRRLRGEYDPSLIRQALSSHPRPSATAISQLRAGHTPLMAFFHRINVVEDPNFPECAQPETTEHYLLLCMKFKNH